MIRPKSPCSENAAGEFPPDSRHNPDRRAYLFRNGREVAAEKVNLVGSGPLGEHVLMLERGGDGLRWIGVTHHPDPTQPGQPEESVMARVRVADAFNEETARIAHPGMTMIITDLPSHPDRRSSEGFVILNS